jgi:hypothetical protein
MTLQKAASRENSDENWKICERSERLSNEEGMTGARRDRSCFVEIIGNCYAFGFECEARPLIRLRTRRRRSLRRTGPGPPPMGQRERRRPRLANYILFVGAQSFLQSSGTPVQQFSDATQHARVVRPYHDACDFGRSAFLSRNFFSQKSDSTLTAGRFDAIFTKREKWDENNYDKSERMAETLPGMGDGRQRN